MDKKSSEIGKLVDTFNIYWKNYQETWNEDNWNYYNKFSILNNSINKNLLKSTVNNNDINFNRNFDMNDINIIKNDINHLNNSYSNDEKVKDKSKNQSRINENILDKGLHKYSNLLFPYDNFYTNKSIDKNETKKLLTIVNDEVEFDSEIIRDEKNEITDLEKEDVKNNIDNSKETNETNLIKDKKISSLLIKEIDIEIDKHYQSEINDDNYLFRKRTKNDIKQSLVNLRELLRGITYN